MCFEKRYNFSPRHLGLLAHVRESLEAAGHTCHVEVEFLCKQQFELHTLIAVPAKKEHPIKFTRAKEGELYT
jgi:hypothetical protein